MKQNENISDITGDELVSGGEEKCPFCTKISRKDANLMAHQSRVHLGRTEKELLDWHL